MKSLDNIMAVVMGGGQGSRLYPLTKERAKPAVPLAGKYRLIDIPISNCINSGLFKIAVLTQYNSVSLHRHISHTYNFDVFHTGWVQIWAAEQTSSGQEWYQGTADAVRKQITEIKSAHVPFVLILAADHLYRMDYGKMAQFHWDKGADVTVAVQPVRWEEAPRLGILKRGSDERILRFAEKPKDELLLKQMVSQRDSEWPFFGSMGIYLFNTDVLVELLEKNDKDDFGRHIIPQAVEEKQVYGYQYGGYWADIGTIRAFYEVNLEIASRNPPFSLIDEGWPIYTHPRFLPGSLIEESKMKDTLIAEGCWIQKAEITSSIIGLRSQIRSGAKIKRSILMGADYYGFFRRGDEIEKDMVLGIGKDCDIEGAIIDKNSSVGPGTIIRPFPRGVDKDEDMYIVRDGIVVIPKGMRLPPGTRIAPD
ncbi:MAG: glucose-1-phosphate adenylyltransferase [Anaerolineaceae bacterium]|nr:glucose-1-phosphate adenylyltransferase [Anaerolineaceae bacterium]